jgi:hypothetical protein
MHTEDEKNYVKEQKEKHIILVDATTVTMGVVT